jgi:hypothetical protein
MRINSQKQLQQLSQTLFLLGLALRISIQIKVLLRCFLFKNRWN